MSSCGSTLIRSHTAYTTSRQAAEHAHVPEYLVYFNSTLYLDQRLTWPLMQEFAGNRPAEACQALLFYMERCRVLDAQPGRQPGHALALEVQKANMLHHTSTSAQAWKV